MGEVINRYKLYVFIWFCRLIGFLLREEDVFFVFSLFVCSSWHSLYTSCVLWCAVLLVLFNIVALFVYKKNWGYIWLCSAWIWGWGNMSIFQFFQFSWLECWWQCCTFSLISKIQVLYICNFAGDILYIYTLCVFPLFSYHFCYMWSNAFLVGKLMVHLGTLTALRKLDQRRGTELLSSFMLVVSKCGPCPLLEYLSCCHCLLEFRCALHL